VYNLTWANFAKARAMAEEFLERATAEGDSGAILTGHRILGFTQAIRGELTLAKDNLSRVIELYEPEQHATLAYRYGQDPRAAATAMLGFTEWQLGFPERAVRLCAEAERQAQRLQHANTRGYVQTFGAARVAVLRRDECAVRRHLDSLRALCEEHNLVFWSGFIATFEGWLLNEAGTYDAAEAAVQDGLRRAQASRTGMFRPHALAILAAAELGADRCGEALRTVDSALATAQRTAEHWSTPELMRLKGEVLLRQADGTGHQEDAEACFHAAIAEARRRDARAWQLRSATSLARLYVAHGKTGAARDALARVLETFDEGFNTPDLRDAQAQLAVLH
jgi:predicted ATPase